MKKKNGVKKVIKKGLVIGALATAGYMFLGPDGKKNQKKLKAFAEEAKKEFMKDAKVVNKKIKVIKKDVKKVVAKKLKELQ
ncbi:MAG: hypothetical protein UU24_C0018G0004 [Candidatus Nomurabacteria bacterium GW2011_GWA2_40_9]|uniref:Uncharacterized protein n=1 Tax=Candidatus Nomurabacteria bacterium GW2011_GWA2_40_9 TaxID=1618734 RepID=A0A0G0WUE8_9BACT|nr:MAG: hypothetical protein UU24_C0018G0004 [Candidatus Nomurabacteria bacterium GW2011_GWA2_40_9]